MTVLPTYCVAACLYRVDNNSLVLLPCYAFALFRCFFSLEANNGFKFLFVLWHGQRRDKWKFFFLLSGTFNRKSAFRGNFWTQTQDYIKSTVRLSWTIEIYFYFHYRKYFIAIFITLLKMVQIFQYSYLPRQFIFSLVLSALFSDIFFFPFSASVVQDFNI